MPKERKLNLEKENVRSHYFIDFYLHIYIYQLSFFDSIFHIESWPELARVGIESTNSCSLCTHSNH